jgi:DNA-binding NtrC family response regulator
MRTAQKVLVIDDDEVVGRSFDRVLSEKGFAVSTALDGEEALKKCGGEDYDVVFTDIKMPGMDGLEVTKRIKAKCPWTPVVIITGYGTAENEAQAKVLGASGFVRKPLTAEVIEGITRKALLEKEVPAPAPEEAGEVISRMPEVAEMEGRLKNAVRFVRNVALLILAPFLGLAYAIALPFIGLGMAVMLGVRAARQRRRSA